jgi:hypothetical protein
MAGFSYDAGTSEAGHATSSPPRKDPGGDWGSVASGSDAQAALDSNDAAGGQSASTPSHADNDGAGQGGDGSMSSVGGGAVNEPGGGGSGASAHGSSTGAGTHNGGASGAGGSGGTAARGGSSGAGGILARGGSAGRGGSGGSGGLGGGGEGGASHADHALLISEYVEGSREKALELRALSTSSLDGCEVVIYSNGASNIYHLDLEGELASGHTYVVCSKELVEQLGPVCDRKFGTTFNGNDAITLECDGAVLDAIGQIGFDPKTAWTGSGVSTADQVLRRRCSVTHGDSIATDSFDPSLEWQSHSLDDLTGLGSPDCD